MKEIFWKLRRGGINQRCRLCTWNKLLCERQEGGKEIDCLKQMRGSYGRWNDVGSIARLKKEVQIYEALMFFSSLMFMPLENQGIDCRQYAKKLFQYAEVYAIKKDENLAGVIAFYCNDFHDFKAFLSNIVVNDIYRGQGIASYMLRLMFQICNERGMHVIGLEVHKDNDVARALYSKHGFREVKWNGEFIYMERSI